MSDQLVNFLPWVSFIAGVSGSLHCVGMCGGLVTASCNEKNDVFRYQVGRLIGYLFLGVLAGSLGKVLNIGFNPMYSGIFIGLLFIYWGIQNFRGKKAEIPTPKFLNKLYTKIWMKVVYKNQTFTKAFFTGLISILLPCGLLYGIVLGTVSLESPGLALTSMFFFWLGTVPSMVVAPEIIRKILNPFKSKLPKTYAISLVTIGLITISFRVSKIHESHAEVKSPEKTVHRCH